jgi:NitT/TauT family transport system substrate-binding protein
MLGYSMDQNLRIAAATHKPVAVLPFADFGVNLASSSIVTAKETADKHAELVARFMRAATRAVVDAEMEPAAAVDAMLKVSPKAGLRDDLIEGLKLTIPLYHTNETKSLPPFRASRAEVKASVDLLSASGTISQASAGRMDDFIAFRFLPN